MDKLGTILQSSGKIPQQSSYKPSLPYNPSVEEIQNWHVKIYNDGKGDLNEKDGYDCPICKNRGFLYRLDENLDMVARECECMKERAKIRAELNSGISTDAKYKTFETFRTEEHWQESAKQSAMQFSQNCIDGSVEWFFIGGQPGSGKTHLAKSIFHALISAGKLVKYMSWKEDAALLKAMLNSEGYKPLCDKYKKAEVLLIDDFLKTRREAYGTYRVPTDGDINLAFEIIKHRDENDLVTVITSEFLIGAIHSFDQSVGGRIKQRCGRYSVEINQDSKKDYRQMQGRYGNA